jgi:hypothetical protein
MRVPVLIAATLLLAAHGGRAEQFLAGFEDVPVMPGIEVVGGAGVAFDSPAGRIVEAYASGPVSRDAVRAFYQTSLPQLGWTRTGLLAFQREGESLTIELLGDEPGTVTVRFELGPTPDR